MYIFTTAIVNIALDILSIIWILAIVVNYSYIANPTILIEIQPYKNSDAFLVLLAVFRITDLNRYTFYHIFEEFLSIDLSFLSVLTFPILVAIFLLQLSIINILRRKLYLDKKSGLNLLYTAIFIPLILFANLNIEIVSALVRLFA